MPNIEGPARRKPLCYDPKRAKFITFDEILTGEERVIPLSNLEPGDLKKLVIQRQRTGPDYTVQTMSGPPMSRDDVVQAILDDEPLGHMTMEADLSHLRDLLEQIEEALK
ncbi:MAG: hypothetical protein ABFS86_07645 [Planctomycetota bacterium]